MTSGRIRVAPTMSRKTDHFRKLVRIGGSRGQVHRLVPHEAGNRRRGYQPDWHRGHCVVQMVFFQAHRQTGSQRAAPGLLQDQSIHRFVPFKEGCLPAQKPGAKTGSILREKPTMMTHDDMRAELLTMLGWTRGPITSEQSAFYGTPMMKAWHPPEGQEDEWDMEGPPLDHNLCRGEGEAVERAAMPLPR